MYNVGLRICSFFIKPKNTHGQNRIPLNQEITYELNKGTPLKVKDFFEILQDFVKRYTYFDDDEKQMRMFAFVQEDTKFIVNKHFRAFYATVKSGAYGYESELIDKDSGEVNYLRTPNDADVKQFSCMFFVPSDPEDETVKKGILIFQEIGAYGVKTITIERLARYISSRYEIIFETRSISPATFVKEVLKNGEIQRVTYVKNSISKDDSDSLVINAGREEVTYFSPLIRQSVVDKLFKPRLLQEPGMVEIDDEVFDREMLGENKDIKFVVNYGKRQNTISMIDYSRFSKVEDVPKELLLNSGQPDRVLLRDYMINIARKYRADMIFT